MRAPRFYCEETDEKESRNEENERIKKETSNSGQVSNKHHSLKRNHSSHSNILASDQTHTVTCSVLGTHY